MIWQLGNSQTYILGSVHALQEDGNKHLDAIDEIYEKANRLIFESDLDGDSGPIRYYENSSLAREISKKLFKDVKNEWRKCGIPYNELNQSKIWFAALLLNIYTGAKKGVLPEYGIDRTMWDRAKNDGKIIEWLEDQTAGVSCFDSSPKGEQIEYLARAARSKKDEFEKVEHIIESWQSSNTNALETVVQEHLVEYPKMYGCLLVERNKAWLNKIKEAIDNNECTIFVLGVLHCIGEESVLDLLLKNHSITSELISSK
ncbi:MAG: TraB/GumN family protein [Gammaproteobacteria bacterium]|nr:TraB/GumN family protein [Gammaproteobacteria bacterium]